MMQRVALCKATFTRLSALKKPSPRNVKKANITMNAAVSGAAKMKSAARPCRFLNMKLFRKALAEWPFWGLGRRDGPRGSDRPRSGCCAGTRRRSLPSFMTSARSARATTSSWSEDTNSTARPSRRAVSRIILYNSPRVPMSTPCVGSSIMSTRDRAGAFQPAADDHFLLRAAGQLPPPPARRAGRKRCLPGGVGEKLSLAPPTPKAEQLPDRAKLGSKMLSIASSSLNNACRSRSAGTKAMPSRDRARPVCADRPRGR